MKTIKLAALTPLLLLMPLAHAGTVADGDLVTFSANTTAKAAEVNQNFTTLKNAVNDNASDISTLQSDVSTLQNDVTSLQSSVTALGAAASAKQGAVSSTVAFTGTVTNITSLAFTPAASGYVIITASGTVEIDQSAAGSLQAYVYLTETSGGMSATDYAYFGHSNSTIAFSYILVPFSFTRVYAVTAGVARTFYMTARETLGDTIFSGYVRGGTLTAVFVPAAL